MSKIKVIETFRRVCTDCHIKGEHYEGYATKKHSPMGNIICEDCKKPQDMVYVVSLR